MLSKQLKQLCKQHLDLFYQHSHSHRDYEEETSILIAKLRYKFKDIKKDRWEELLHLLQDKVELLWLLLKLESATVDSIKDKETRLLSLGSTTLASLELEDVSSYSWTRDYSKDFSQISAVVHDTASTVDSAYQSEHSDTESVHLSDLVTKTGLLSWENYRETDASSPFLTECGYQAFQQAYFQFKKSPLDTPSDFVPMNQLVSKLLMLCNGLASDLFVWEEERFQLKSPIRSGGITCEALKSVLGPCIAHGNRIRKLSSLANELESLPSKTGLTGAAIGRAVTKIIKEMYSQTASLTVSLQNLEMPLLKLLFHIEPLFEQSKILLGLLEKKPSGTRGTHLIPFIYEELLQQEAINRNRRVIAMLVYVLHQSLIPLMNWVDCWLLIAKDNQQVWEIQDLNDCDPFHEFFILLSDERFEFVDAFPFPPFLSQSLAREIFETGYMWRRISNGKSLQIGSGTSIQSRWLLQSDHVQSYQKEISAYCDSILYEQRKASVEEELRRLQVAQALQLEQLEKVKTQEMIDYAKMELQAERQRSINQKKLELKKNIESFLEERRRYIALQSRAEKDLEERENLKVQKDTDDRNRVLMEEMEILQYTFELAMEQIDQSSKRLEWRKQRFALDPKRRELLSKDWIDTMVHASHADGYSDSVAKSEVDSAREKLFEEIAETTFEESQILDGPIELVFQPKGNHEVSEEEKAVVLPTELREIVQLTAETAIQTNSDSHALEAPESIVSPSTHSSIPKRISVLDNMTESRKLEWLFDPSLAPLPSKQEQLRFETYEPYEIFRYHEELATKMINLEETLSRTVLELWKQQLRLLSAISLGTLFTSSGSVDHDDLRYYLEIVKSFYFFGSGHFQTKIVDKFFKDSVNGMALNSRITNRFAGRLSEFTWDVFDNAVSSKGHPFGSTISKFVSMDLAGIEKGSHTLTRC
jgi:hypothetical protein